MSTVLVVAAHPDDEVLGCGGAIARHARAGDGVSVLILGEGVTSRHARREEVDPKDLGDLHARAHEASQVMGAREIRLANLPDNRFDTIPLLDIVKKVEAEIARTRPQTVYVQHGGDLNIDHAITFRATVTATRPFAGTPIREVLAFEVGSSTEWAFQKFEPAFRPSVFVDIAETLEIKLRAMRCYDVEMRPFPHPRSEQALRAQAVRWGSVSGTQAAEAFEVVRAIR